MPLARFPVPALLLTAALGVSQVRAAPTCPSGTSSLSLASCALAQQLGPAAQNAPVVVVELKSDRELSGSDALRQRLQAALTTALHDGRPMPGELRKLRVEVSVEKRGGTLLLQADLRRATGLWQRIRHQKPPAERHAFVEAAFDAELRALVPPPPLVVGQTLKVKAPERGIVALACGPVGAEGGQELLVVTRSSVRVGRIAGKTFAERKQIAWSALSPVSPSPLREPIASALVTRAGNFRVGITDRRDALELSPELTVQQRFDGRLPLTPELCAARSGLGLSSQEQPCSGSLQPARAAAATLDAVATSSAGWLGRELATARLARGAAGLSVGAQLALGDADGDGAAELAYSLDTLEGSQDRLKLVTLTGGQPTPRFDLAAPSIGAIAICQRSEGPGMAPIVLASGDELWVLR
jgi:hypothetical protein